MTQSKTIQLVLITGFLGSGKTSVINSLLGHLTDRTVGLILNDFGSIVVDRALVEQSQRIVATRSLSGGQIFCSCLSGSFIDAVEAMVVVEPDVIIVEASGLAKPSPLLEIVSIIQQRTNHAVSYSGMLCVIDADRYTLLSQALKTLEEQVVFSDWFVINKCDLVDSATLAQVTNAVTALRPLAPLMTTQFGAVPTEFVKVLMDSASQPVTFESAPSDSYAGWGVHGRPKTCLFWPPDRFDREVLHQFLKKVSSHLLRMKGFVSLADGTVLLIDAVGPHVTLAERNASEMTEFGIVCIHAADFDAVEFLCNAWRDLAHTEALCEANQ
jgi:G3E family GTPase